jgi:hypothetical protein
MEWASGTRIREVAVREVNERAQALRPYETFAICHVNSRL